jgi:hypothetical protein
MADSFTESTSNSFFGRIWSSILGALFGLACALLSVPVLYWNEGRTNFADVARKAISVPADARSTEGEGKLVSVTGALTTPDVVGDPQYLRAGNHIALRRDAEMYAWEEEKTEKEEKQLGGSSKTITTYSYKTDWTSRPHDSSDFRHSEGHENPSMPVHSETFYASTARLGAFDFNPAQAELPSFHRLQVSSRDDLAGSASGARMGSGESQTPQGEVLYQGRGSSSRPVVGDVRISFEAIEPLPTATMFGRREGTKIVAAAISSDETFLRVLEGTREAAIGELATEHSMTTCLLRLAGFVMMWLGTAALFGPINTFMDIVPIAGSAGRFLVTLALFPITFAISTVVILVSIVAHSLVAMSLVALACIGAVIFHFKRKHADAPRPSPAV